jgi:hypothetical protein
MPKMVTIGWYGAAPHIGKIQAYTLYFSLLYLFFFFTSPLDQTTEPICSCIHEVLNDAD